MRVMVRVSWKLQEYRTVSLLRISLFIPRGTYGHEVGKFCAQVPEPNILTDDTVNVRINVRMMYP